MGGDGDVVPLGDVVVGVLKSVDGQGGVLGVGEFPHSVQAHLEGGAARGGLGRARELVVVGTGLQAALREEGRIRQAADINANAHVSAPFLFIIEQII